MDSGFITCLHVQPTSADPLAVLGGSSGSAFGIIAGLAAILIAVVLLVVFRRRKQQEKTRAAAAKRIADHRRSLVLPFGEFTSEFEFVCVCVCCSLQL